MRGVIRGVSDLKTRSSPEYQDNFKMDSGRESQKHYYRFGIFFPFSRYGYGKTKSSVPAEKS